MRELDSESMAEVLDVINKLTPEQTGGFFAYDGTSVEY